MAAAFLSKLTPVYNRLAIADQFEALLGAVEAAFQGNQYAFKVLGQNFKKRPAQRLREARENQGDIDLYAEMDSLNTPTGSSWILYALRTDQSHCRTLELAYSHNLLPKAPSTSCMDRVSDLPHL